MLFLDGNYVNSENMRTLNTCSWSKNMYYTTERKNGNSIKKPNMTGSFITQR